MNNKQLSLVKPISIAKNEVIMKGKYNNVLNL